MDEDNKLMLIYGGIVVSIVLALGAVFGIQSHQSGQQMRDCVATGNHSWVQKQGDYYECVPDSQVQR